MRIAMAEFNKIENNEMNMVNIKQGMNDGM